ncbi:hypothetical protein [Methylomonas albis]|uniref:DUF2971 domain-containing protein n=1 Tax=Methylomonas albis TaxID=1854563 RepID=A0ABR9D009_9GAMM|nr:DUF2971 domain-containing protein [Methylomonas albis]MBD9356463.1 DUF2971 domain-containing protein [Methylomonas albis]CAD6879567.1 hypothetical protein [Methylomonas albis]
MTFYKYTNTNTTNLILENESLRWSSPVIFNDIEECQFTPFTKEQYINSHEKCWDILTECAKGISVYNSVKLSDINKTLIYMIRHMIEVGTYRREHFSEFMANFNRSPESDFRDFLNIAQIKCFRILCVTTEYDNRLMWAHYADQHYGCVLEIDEPFKKKPNLLREGPIKYHENLTPSFNILDYLLYGETKKHRDSLVNDVVFSKRSLWGYENEYRFLFYESFGEISVTVNCQTNSKHIDVKNQSEVLYTDVPICIEAIKSITFGARTKDDDIEGVLKILSKKEYKCMLYRMKMEDGLMKRQALKS